ncbi:hypothetical protein NL676_025746 [Syzygium grande]|nr:hypothetical protein NL676_025746 [Syzygium grande]
MGPSETPRSFAESLLEIWVRFLDVEHVIMKNDRSLVEVFKMFDLIRVITTEHSTITRITKEVRPFGNKPSEISKYCR